MADETSPKTPQEAPKAAPGPNAAPAAPKAATGELERSITEIRALATLRESRRPHRVQLAHMLENHDREQTGRAVEDMWGDTSKEGCGGWTLDGPPCGGCFDCAIGQAMHGLPDHQAYLAEADRILGSR